MPAPTLAQIDAQTLQPEAPLLHRLIAEAALDAPTRARIAARGADLVRAIRADARPGLMEVFLAEYGLSTDEGIALMCLAEALLRVPDAETMDALIEDKIAPSDWGRHLGQSASSLVNASTWALMLTGRVLDPRAPGMAGHLRAAIRRLGEPVIRKAVGRAMKEMGRQFVLGETISAAMTRAAKREAQGYSYSYDMLGEAARTAADAQRYEAAYAAAITAISARCKPGALRDNPGISVKLSALHPRYEVAQEARVMAELVPVVTRLARMAAAADMSFTIDAEEADRLTLSLRVIEAVLACPDLAGWDGFAVVVQAYGRRAGAVIDWLHALATRLDRKIMLRLVKGAYWDAEIKRAQVLGLADFPVFTRKQATDVSYIALARKLLGMSDRIYPQFAGHNAHTVAAILEMAPDLRGFEFQRLHGMGEALHDLVLRGNGTRCRIYAPVGAHRDLLAYLVRRLLENGANSSFVNQIVDETVPPELVAACPFAAIETCAQIENPALARPVALFPGRVNSRGFDLTDAGTLAMIETARAPFATGLLPGAEPLLAAPCAPCPPVPVTDPASGAPVGEVRMASGVDVAAALDAARPWAADAATRAATLDRAADLYEENFGQIFATLAREAGKNLPDAVGELREAVDFLRYYAAQAPEAAQPRGIFTCISPWNFPLAIFTGQIAAALAAGNGVLAKPAEQTPLIATLAVRLLHQAGVPATALQLLPGDGPTVGAALTSDPRVAGVAFTGATETAQAIRRAMAEHLDPGAPLIAETGGLNAMVVDSTALPEQAVRDILASAFQSAGQRCSALRCLYLQEDIAPHVIEMLIGAMDELRLGTPWDLTTDVGPVIDAEAFGNIADYIAAAGTEVIHQIAAPKDGLFIPPTLIRVPGIAALGREIFGPVLHVATFAAEDLGQVIADINATGYGLTFGLHSRIDSRVQAVTEALHVGNIYVNRNQIGAVVGAQPFGGEGLSGTGPKAGGPEYLVRFGATPPTHAPAPQRSLPGPTGESNRLTLHPRAPILCLGPGAEQAAAQAAAVQALGGTARLAPDAAPESLTQSQDFSAALYWGEAAAARAYACALAARSGPILPLITGLPDAAHCFHERHICIDTTAAGGNAQLLAGAGSA
ncbi:bifunctional proline dehydrogenase/L-glutamate gamma-semialdehyde dehydrogenase PutA [Paenirhodobacter sp. CAU 1674]|uniref:bifunctional proline dehydrogenase/L-glutamate gamma-semialdehyde dehydrogenase PutA n=1 Tax=Paenirhodobacter sp. CAU 1674 TaxID=3032596 RepID=UPI0023D992E5|nr:bifunctional proline dehydrogenase/L-glutamate gamma-semialdehyde dehydrogenase PutA [Paenirhodobacter sp. CAU 1674]MDF2140939.1 bifunctional proline dehydrogenase/L-glutamate gamma-semialdehyde dehydrogenase PutA [Paenirhodobacter sp. CAU 1674]